MESLTIPASGPVYLDSNAFIYSVERIEPYRTLLEPLWKAAQADQLKIVTSELTLLETLVKPLRDADQTLENLFRELFRSREVRLLPVTAATWERAARIRATTGLKTPDALHAAAALDANCTLMITNDRIFKRVSSVTVVVLSEFV